MTAVQERLQPPANIEAEQGLLGAILVNNSAYSRVSDFLQAEHFANAVHGRIYAAIGKLIESGTPADTVLIKQALGDDATLVPLGGTSQYLASLIKAAVTVVNAEHYGRAILDAAQRRALVDAGQAIIEDACAYVPLAEIVPRALADLTAAAPASWQPIVIDVGADHDPIPPRAWLLGTTFCREFVSSILAAGATGKTALRIAQLLALATGRPLTGEHVFVRCRVMLLGLEDSIHELRRRVRAAMLHYGVRHEDIAGWFYIAALPPEGGKLVSEGRTPMRNWIEREIAAKQLDLVCFDPLIKTHDLPENDNNALERVIETLVSISIAHKISVDAPHHMSKGPSDPGNADKGRGGSAFKDGGRLVYTLNSMSEQEAKQFDIAADERRRYIRFDSGKVNLAASAKTRWFELIGVKIGNGTDTYPSGDEIQVAVIWTPPETWAGLSNDALNAALDDIEAGLPDGRRYSSAGAARETAAWRALQKRCPGKSEKQCREIVSTWCDNSVLYNETYKNPKTREDAQGLRVNHANRPS